VEKMAVQICMITTNNVGRLAGRAETVRRDLYRLLDSVAHKSPIAWVVRYDVCQERVLPRVEKLNREFRELTGKDLAVVFVATVDENFLRQLVGYSEPPKSKKAVILSV
jgi:hypothetical protein